MILGTGVDIIEISRVGKAAKREGFVKRIFSADEIAYWEQKNCAAETLAGAFAAKEAVSKALGTGFGRIRWTEVEILHTQSGAPYVRLSGEAFLRLRELCGSNVHISISHCKGYAMAQAIVE
ncbi:MAG: holo-ACP synthase [Clostridia bacterium]|nr:holo-ACP synthase [Clostridia bacterium]